MRTPFCNDEQDCPAPRRVFAYCHDSVGIGHLRRTLAICERVGASHPCASFLLATGTPYASLFPTSSRIDSIKLPALCKDGSGAYGCKYLALSLDRIVRCRESLLLQAVKHFAPDVVLVDKAPIGVCGELIPTLRWLGKHRPEVRVIFGMRDIEDAPHATIRQWSQNGVYEALEHYFDEIWVYGSRDVYDVARHYQLPAAVRGKLRFMGYVAREPCDHRPPERPASPEVLVTVGGGSDGELVLEAYLSETAAAIASLGGRSTIIGGPDLPQEVAARLRETTLGIEGARWVDFEGCMSCRMRQADVVVSMGGYNTMCELARHRKPAVVIPRIHPRLEQSLRAELWEGFGLISTLHPTSLTSSELRTRTIGMLDRTPPNGSLPLDLRGLDRVAQRFDHFWSPEPCDAHPLRV